MDAERAGLVAKSQSGEGHYDRFRNRIVFPIREPSGNVLGFGGRGLGPDDTPKYLNSPESPLYRKSRVLFGLPLALDSIRQNGRVIVVEGYFDLIALHRVGIEEVVAPCGTALTAEHARRLRRYAHEVVLLFDGRLPLASGRRNAACRYCWQRDCACAPPSCQRARTPTISSAIPVLPPCRAAWSGVFPCSTR